ncbi:MAG: apolipoprotein N-acyltransferase [Acidimicrobiia bacterium]
MRDRALACVAAGIVLGISFPPVDLGPAALVALVPLLWAWRGATPARAALYGFLFGLAFFGVLLEWTRYFGVVAVLVAVVGEAAFIAIAGGIVAVLERRGLRTPWLIGAVWVVVEGARGRIPFGGVPWGEIGAALHDIPVARVFASLGGVTLVSFVVVVFNGLVLDAIDSVRHRTQTRLAWAGVGLSALVACTVVASVARYEPEVTGDLRFALLQGLDQNRDLTTAEIRSDFLMRHHLELAARLRGEYDLIVFPESALERDPTRFRDVRAALLAVAEAHDAVVLANARVLTARGRLSNSNLAYDPDGELQGIYAKQHLVPYGEYVPLRDLLPFIEELDRIPFDYERGTERVMFRAGGHDFGTVICYESAFAPLVRGFVRDGAELIVVTTNNRSYRRSGLSAQHLALSQMRAAETGRPVLHASISGITGVIEPDGRVHDTSELFENRITSGTVQTTTGQTPYVRFGDWALVVCGLALVAVTVLGGVRARWRTAVDSGS